MELLLIEHKQRQPADSLRSYIFTRHCSSMRTVPHVRLVPSGEEHTYEGSVVDHYDILASPQPGEHRRPLHLTGYDQQLMTVSKSPPQPANVS